MKKFLLSAFTFAMLLVLVPKQAEASLGGHPLKGYETKELAAEAKLERHYYDLTNEEEAGKYYKFKAGTEEGMYLISVQTSVENAQAADMCTSSIKLLNEYGTVIASSTTGGNAADYGVGTVDNKPAKTMDLLLPVYDKKIQGGKYYYILLESNDGNSTLKNAVRNDFCVEFYKFKPADYFEIEYEDNGDLSFEWNNLMSYNINESRLVAFDGFALELSQGSKVKTIYVGNGEATSYKLKPTAPELLALGYPKKSVTVKLCCIQNYQSALNEKKKTTKYFYSPSVHNTKVIGKNTKLTIGGINYRITNARGDGKGAVAVVGLDKSMASKTKIVIKDTVAWKGITYKITGIDKKAFFKNKKIKTVQLGANIKTIGKEAFRECSNLTTFAISSQNLKKVDKDALLYINTKAKIQVPKKKKKAYKKLFKGKHPATVTYENLKVKK